MTHGLYRLKDNFKKSTICNERTEKLPITETFAKSVCRSQNLGFKYFMTAGLSSISCSKFSWDLWCPLKEHLQNIEAYKGDAIRNDGASRIMKELLKESVYYPQIMGKLLTTKKVRLAVRWSLVGRLDRLRREHLLIILGWDEAKTGKAK